MKKLAITPIRKDALIKLGILLPIFVFFTISSWISLLIVVSVWSYCLYGALYGREENIRKRNLIKTTPQNDGNLGCGSRTMRKWIYGY